MKRLHVAISPIDDRIYAGHVLADGKTWAAGKQDVTGKACAAVAQLCILQGGTTTVYSSLHGAIFEITAKDVNEES